MGMMNVLRPVFCRVILGAVCALLLFTGLLFVSHLQAESPVCFDELLLRWNDFAAEANRHIETNSARRSDHEKAHARLDRQWQSLKALSCW